jgi:hypothetical protein
MKPPVHESAVLASILEYLATRKDIARFWRQNSGGMTIDNRYVAFIRAMFRKASHSGRCNESLNAKQMGNPDIAGWLDNGHATAIAIEVKRPGKSATEAQQRYLDDVTRAGGVAIVAHSIDDVMAALDARK